MRLPIDHLVFAASELQRGMAEVERLLGISPIIGGVHPGRGTRNAIISLGADAYLEILAPDAQQPRPERGRWLGVDTITRSRITAWAVKARNLANLRRRAQDAHVPIGDVVSGSRRRADGTLLSWSLTDPDPCVADGVIPFFIDWGSSPHPGQTAPQGARLVEFRVEHPDAVEVQRMLRAIDLDVAVSRAALPALVATIDCPRGRIELR